MGSGRLTRRQPAGLSQGRHAGSGEFYRLSLKDGKDSQGDPVRLTSTMAWPSSPVWIPDSREILFAARGGLFRLDALTGGTPSRLPFVDQDGPAGSST
jgi:hypothetical protein